ncbi:hypothetical protein BDV19DRAFT_336352 [Aspergillus venezuelensis]
MTPSALQCPGLYKRPTNMPEPPLAIEWLDKTTSFPVKASKRIVGTGRTDQGHIRIDKQHKLPEHEDWALEARSMIVEFHLESGEAHTQQRMVTPAQSILSVAAAIVGPCLCLRTVRTVTTPLMTPSNSIPTAARLTCISVQHPLNLCPVLPLPYPRTCTMPLLLVADTGNFSVRVLGMPIFARIDVQKTFTGILRLMEDGCFPYHQQHCPYLLSYTLRLTRLTLSTSSKLTSLGTCVWQLIAFKHSIAKFIMRAAPQDAPLTSPLDLLFEWSLE